jgi:hypothetical protein
MMKKEPSAGGRRVVPVRCEECYMRTDLIRSALGEREIWPTDSPNCKHPPIKSCPSMKAAFARARASVRG